MKKLVVTVLMALCAACASNSPKTLPSGAAAYELVPAAASAEPRDYVIGPLDVLNITVFQEPDLSLRDVQVDARGNILFPLVGQIAAQGRTAAELSEELAQRLDEVYLRDPQVSVVVATSASQKVVVDGEVTQPGVYDVRGNTTLLEALALARGPTRVASIKEVVIFRNIDGQRMGAVFDVRAIRRGEASDPLIEGNDVVVVGLSNVSLAWQDFLKAAPVLAVFRPLVN